MHKIHNVVLAVACLGMQAMGATIPVTYNFVGGPTAPPVMVGTTLIVDGFFTGSVLSGDPNLNAMWNPVSYIDHSVIELTTGLLNGTFTMTFANGECYWETCSKTSPNSSRQAAQAARSPRHSPSPAEPANLPALLDRFRAGVWQDLADRHRGVEQSILRRFRNRNRQRSS